FRTVYTVLLPDAEIPENILQKIIRGDLSGDLSKEVERAADIHRDKIIGDLIVQTGEDVQKRFAGLNQGVVVAGVCDDRISSSEFVEIDQGENLCLEPFEVLFPAGGYENCIGMYFGQLIYQLWISLIYFIRNFQKGDALIF